MSRFFAVGLSMQFILPLHTTKVVAAVFLATGQDPAHTVEGSNCITLMEEVKHSDAGAGRPGDLRVTVTLPSLLVGTVGGGTDLAAQAACLKLMGIPAHVSGGSGGGVGGGGGGGGSARSQGSRDGGGGGGGGSSSGFNGAGTGDAGVCMVVSGSNHLCFTAEDIVT